MLTIHHYQTKDQRTYSVIESPGNYAAVCRFEKNKLSDIQLYDAKTQNLAAEFVFLGNKQLIAVGDGETRFGGALTRLSEQQVTGVVNLKDADHSHIYLPGMNGNCPMELSWGHGFNLYLTENGSKTVADLHFSDSLRYDYCTIHKGNPVQELEGASAKNNPWIKKAEALQEKRFLEEMTLEEKAKVLEQAAAPKRKVLTDLLKAASNAKFTVPTETVKALRDAAETDRLQKNKKMSAEKIQRMRDAKLLDV